MLAVSHNKKASSCIWGQRQQGIPCFDCSHYWLWPYPALPTTSPMHFFSYEQQLSLCRLFLWSKLWFESQIRKRFLCFIFQTYTDGTKLSYRKKANLSLGCEFAIRPLIPSPEDLDEKYRRSQTQSSYKKANSKMIFPSKFREHKIVVWVLMLLLGNIHAKIWPYGGFGEVVMMVHDEDGCWYTMRMATAGLEKPNTRWLVMRCCCGLWVCGWLWWCLFVLFCSFILKSRQNLQQCTRWWPSTCDDGARWTGQAAGGGWGWYRERSVVACVWSRCCCVCGLALVSKNSDKIARRCWDMHVVSQNARASSVKFVGNHVVIICWWSRTSLVVEICMRVYACIFRARLTFGRKSVGICTEVYACIFGLDSVGICTAFSTRAFSDFGGRTTKKPNESVYSLLRTTPTRVVWVATSSRSNCWLPPHISRNQPTWQKRNKADEIETHRHSAYSNHVMRRPTGTTVGRSGYPIGCVCVVQQLWRHTDGGAPCGDNTLYLNRVFITGSELYQTRQVLATWRHTVTMATTRKMPGGVEGIQGDTILKYADMTFLTRSTLSYVSTPTKGSNALIFDLLTGFHALFYQQGRNKGMPQSQNRTTLLSLVHPMTSWMSHDHWDHRLDQGQSLLARVAENGNEMMRTTNPCQYMGENTSVAV